MARSLSLSLSKAYLSSPAARSSPALFNTVRSLSTLPSKPDPAADDSSNDPLLRKLEDVIHRIIVRRSAPDWLPFLPGSSYWVPPARSASGSLGIAQLLEKLANPPLTSEESLSTTTSRGYPSSDYFIKGEPPHLLEAKTASTKTKSETTSNHVSQPEEDEG